MNRSRFLSRATGPRSLPGKGELPSDASSTLLGLAGMDGKLKFLNPAWEKALGYPPQDLLERPLRELKRQREHAEAAALVDRLLAEDGFDPLEVALRRRDGTCRWFLWHRRLDQERQAIFIAGYDITEEKARDIASMLRSYERSRATGDGEGSVR
jgi:PAS domain S-box-containing protein